MPCAASRSIGNPHALLIDGAACHKDETRTIFFHLVAFHISFGGPFDLPVRGELRKYVTPWNCGNLLCQ